MESKYLSSNKNESVVRIKDISPVSQAKLAQRALEHSSLLQYLKDPKYFLRNPSSDNFSFDSFEVLNTPKAYARIRECINETLEADINIGNCLHYAILTDDKELVLDLCKHGINVEQKD